MKQLFFAGTLVIVLSTAMASSFAAGSHDGGPGESAVGAPGKAAQVTRTVNIDMNDNMRFTPAEISAKKGETIRLVVKNSGQTKHEMVIGTPKELKEHYDMMMKMPGMEHDEANKVTVAPGKTGEIIWRFTKAGKVDFACLQPGHFDAGMKGVVQVAGSAASAKNGKKAPAKH